MKIISIKFQNLNSLKGVHAIRFDRPPFNESNLFAITGPTGAGKTTILDAITIALYGRAHRHDKDAHESMTRHTGESYAEVEFEANNTVYRSKWLIKRSRGKADGALQTPKMELCLASTGEIIVSHPLSAVQQKIVETCGLDYQQFLRSVMLSQGDFTRFLKANESERSELLEKITDTGIYSQISTFIFEKSKEEQTRLQQMQLRINDVKLLTNEELTAYHEQLLELDSREKKLTIQKATSTEHLQWLDKINGLWKKKQSLQEESTRLQDIYERNRPVFEQLQRHKKILVFMPALTEIDTHHQNLASIQHHIYLLDEQLPLLKEVCETNSKQFYDAEKAYREAIKQQQEAEPNIIEAEKQDVLIDSQIKQVTHAGDTLQIASTTFEQLKKKAQEQETAMHVLSGEIERLSEWLSLHEHEKGLEKTITTLAYLLEKWETYETQVRKTIEEQQVFQQQELSATNELEKLATIQQNNRQSIEKLYIQRESSEEALKNALAGKTLEDLENDAAMLPKLISLCERLLELAAIAANMSQFARDLHDREQQIAAKLVQEAETLTELTARYEQEKNLLIALQENVTLQLLVRKYEEDRATLQPEKPCPLCGSTHHPFIENNYRNEFGEAERKQHVQQTKVESLTQQVNDKKISIQQFQIQLTNLQEQQAKNDQEYQKTMDACDIINRQLPKPLEIGKTEMMVAVINAKKNQQAILNQRISVIRNLEKQLQELNNQLSRLNEETVRADGEQNQTTLRMEHARASFVRSQVEIKRLNEECEQLSDNISKLLEPQQIGFPSDENRGILAELQQRLNLLLEQQNTLEQKADQINEVNINLRHTKKDIEEKATHLHQLTDAFVAIQTVLKQMQEQRMVCFGDKDTKVERQRHIQTVQSARDNYEMIRKKATDSKQELEIALSKHGQWMSDIQRLQQSGKQLSEILLQKIQAIGIESIEVLRACVIPEEAAERAEKLYQDAERKQTAVTRLSEEIDKELEIETAKHLTEDTAETLSAHIHMLGTSISEMQQEIGRTKQMIATEEHNRILHQQLITDIASQRTETTRWEKLSKLVGSADGKKFSRFAQGLTLERLIQLANRHIVTLTDRYLIRKTPGHDLELEIVDQYQADIVRPMTSLSGGESFLVSLALALGLSELASRKTQINSLFIDEGFGMLDADTLDVAISTLENLQANGKTIGVISHVEALKERIGTQIQVIKQQGGHSIIKIMAYDREYHQ